MDGFHKAACPVVTQTVEKFLETHALKPGAVQASVLLNTDVYVAWSRANRALHSRVLPFETPAQAEQAVQLLTTPAPAV